MWHPAPDHPKVVPLNKKFPLPNDAPRGSVQSRWKEAADGKLTLVWEPTPSVAPYQEAHINPLLMRDIKEAADVVRVAMHGAPERGVG